MPESKDFPSSLVTVCGAEVAFFHTTVVPTLTVNVAGLKVYGLVVSVVIITVVPLVVPEPAGVFVAAGVVPVPLLLPLVVLEPPQADKRIIIANATTDNHTHACFLEVGIIHEVMFEFVRIVGLFFFL